MCLVIVRNEGPMSQSSYLMQTCTFQCFIPMGKSSLLGGSMGCPMKNLYLVLLGAPWAVRGHLLSPTIHDKCKYVMSYSTLI